jgi:hypothetical protein
MVSAKSFTPDQLKAKFIEENLIPGCFIYLFCEFTTPPKDKYFLVASTNPLVLLFIVNSNINPFIANRPKLLESQVLLKNQDYGFLKHDSYLACHEVINYFTLDNIKEELNKDLSRIKGRLNVATRDEIVKILNKNISLTLEQRVIIIKSLNSITY